MTPDGGELTDAMIESVRRAVKRLADDDVIELTTVMVERDVAGRSRPVRKQMLAARKVEG